MEDILILSIAWVLYFVLHSALASESSKQYVKRKYPKWDSSYRLFYNVIAVITLLPIIYLLIVNRGQPFLIWPEGLGWLKISVVCTALACFLWSLRYYDLGEFLGLAPQIRTSVVPRLVISPIHRFVRHPWYCCAIFILWFRDMDTAQFASTLLISAYFVVGSCMEEKKLIREFGDSYKEYQRKVPALIPMPWKYLSKDDPLISNSQINSP